MQVSIEHVQHGCFSILTIVVVVFIHSTSNQKNESQEQSKNVNISHLSSTPTAPINYTQVTLPENYKTELIVAFTDKFYLEVAQIWIDRMLKLNYSNVRMYRVTFCKLNTLQSLAGSVSHRACKISS